MRTLALALALVALPVVVHAAPTIEENCAASALDALQFTAPDKIPEMVNEVDRRIAATVGEERAFAADAEHLRSPIHGVVPLALLVLGALLVMVSLRARRRVPLALGGVVLLALASVGLWHRGQRLASSATHARELLECRLRLSDTRGMLVQRRFSRCTADLAEADEDLVAWITRLRGGEPPALTAIEKTHHDLSVPR